MALIKEYRSDMQKKELLLTFTDDGRAPEYYEKMVRFNDIAGVLKFRTDINDGTKQYVYAADGMRPLVLEYEDCKPGFAELKNVLYDIIESVEDGRRFLLSEDDFVICDDCVFLDEEKHAYTVCLPGYGKPLKNQLSALFEFYMDKIDYKDKAAVVALYEIYRKSREPDFGFEHIRKAFGERPAGERRQAGTRPESRGTEKGLLIDAETGIENSAGNSRLSDTENRSLSNAGNGADYCGSCKEIDSGTEMREILPSENLHEQEKEFGAITGEYSKNAKKKRRSLLSFLSKNEGTKLLYNSREGEMRLESADESESISITRWPFVIGKGDPSHKPDYALQYPQISRVHARLSKDENGEIRIEDMRSLNGTYVNGKEVSPGKPVRLNPGDAVCFANRRFILRAAI